MEKGKKNFNYILIVFSIVCLSLFFSKNFESKKLRSELTYKQKTIDSLNQEIFTHELILTRYDVTLEKLWEKDSICADNFETTMSMETE
jgi:hypothetical protein